MQDRGRDFQGLGMYKGSFASNPTSAQHGLAPFQISHNGAGRASILSKIQNPVRDADNIQLAQITTTMSDSEEIEVAEGGYQVLPKDVTEEIGSIKLFNKWSYEDVEIRDISLTDYIQIRAPVYISHSAGRYAQKRFRKAQCPIIERLTNSLMMNGRNNGKKLMAVRIVAHAFEIIHIMTDQNPIQVAVDAIVNCGPREDSTRIGSAGTVRRQAVDVSPLRRVNQAIALLTIGAREAAFRNVKSVAECLAEELINAAKGSSNSYAIKKKDELERVAKSNRMISQFSLTAYAVTLLPLHQFVSSTPILAEPRDALKSFTLEQKPNPHWKGYDGPAAYLRAFYKYNVEPPQAVAKFAESKGNGSGSVTATPFPSSFDRWVFSTILPTAQISGQKLYNPSSSTTSTLLNGEIWSISYGDGSFCSGTVVSETVVIGGITVSKQGLEIASQASSSFTSDPASSGLLGLAFSSLNAVVPTQQKVWFENIQDRLTAPVFSVDLKKGAAGTYTFGKVEREKFKGSIAYTPINKRRGFWEFSADGFQIGSSSPNYTSYPMDSIADIGTTLLLLPSAVVKAYYADVKGATYDAFYGAMLYPCPSILPDFVFGLSGGYRGVIPGGYVRYGQVDRTGTTCYGGIQDKGGLPFLIWGDILLKAQYVVFDAGQTRIGFANKRV
ncbi:hypothetical protein HYALB_00007935 [Hymenoscyphus albidus]|nr:hypothetical protein HYALB_00007935 [Hymenoscyphus albidus]